MKTTTSTPERKVSNARGKSGAFFLFARDLRKTWPSYVVTMLLGLIFGAIASVLLEGIFVIQDFGGQGESIERVFNSLLVDFWFLAIIPAFLINFAFNRDYAGRFTQDNMSRRLCFLKSMPIPVRDLVASRALASLLSLVLSATPFFVVSYLLFEAGGGRLPVEVYLPFAAIWVTYSLVAGGFYLYVWLGFPGSKDLWITITLPVLLLLVTVTSNFALGIGLVAGSLGLAREYGLPTAAILVLGAATFVLWMIATSQRLKRREL